MSAYPEFICIDATYKLLDIRTPVLIIINEDGNGLSEIVSVGLLVEENAETLKWFLSKFKENNPEWMEIKSIMADKDLNERRLLREHFPNAHILICIFHAMRSFNREISTNKLNITLTQRQTALDIIQKMVYSRNADDYNNLYEDLMKKCPLSVIEYFNKNWHEIRDEWTLGQNFQQSNFLNTTNNRLESINAKIKTLVERYSTLSNFIDDFFKVILIMNDERDHKAANLIQKVPVNFYEKESVLYNYHQLLTSYAFQFVEKQYSTRNHNAKQNYDTTIESCNCGSRTSMLLPCRHILKKREEHGIDMFHENLCNKRWTRKHYFSNQRIFLTDVTDVPNEYLSCTSESHTIIKPSTKLNQHQKFSKAWLLSKSLAGLVSEAGDARYHMRLRQLIQIKTAWENDEDIVITNSQSEDISRTEGNETVVQDEDENHILDIVAQDEDENRISEVGQNDEITIIEVTQDDLPIIYNNDPNIATNCEIEIFDVVSTEENGPSVSFTSSTSTTDLNIGEIKMPIAMKKRGRPKGRSNTVIGLSAKRKNNKPAQQTIK